MKEAVHTGVAGTVALLVLLGGTTGCSSGDDDSGAGSTTPPGGDDLSNIAGLWDTSFADEGEQFVSYLQISEDGTVSSYEFDPEVDGSNCYGVELSTLRVEGNDRYTLTDADGISVVLTIINRGDILTVSFVDAFDDDEDGDTTDLIVEEFPSATGIDPMFVECA